MGGGFGLTKDGAGTLVLSAAGTGTLVFAGLGAGAYTGNTLISQGKLFLDGASVFSGGTSTIVTVQNGAFLEIGPSASLGGVRLDTWPGGLITTTVVDSPVVFTTSGTLNADAAKFNGTQIISSGIIVSSSANYFGTIPATAVSDRIIIETSGTLGVLANFDINSTQGVLLQSGTGTFNVVGSGSLAPRLFLESAVSGSGTLRKTGGGNLRLLGTNSYTGGTIIEQGIIGISSDAALGSGGLQIIGSEFVGAQSGAGTWQLTSAQDFTGTAHVDAGTLAIGGSDTLASASKIFLATGGTLGATAAGLTIPAGQTLGGYGRVDVGANALVFNAGAFLSPGGSVGTLNETGATTWNGGMNYVFEVNDADGTPGISPGWDLFSTSGELTLAASGANQVVVDLTSLNDATPGLAANFNQNYNYAWKFVVAGSAIGTFDSSWFNVTTANFTNSTNGTFYVARGDQLGGIGASGSTNELYVVYAAAPEPGSIVIAAIGLGILGWRLRRRARVSA